MIYPYVVAGGFTVAKKNARGPLRRPVRPDPHPGRRRSARRATIDQALAPQDTADKPMDTNAGCTDGEQEPPRRGEGPAAAAPAAAYRPPVATYDQSTGKVTWGDQAPPAPTSPTTAVPPSCSATTPGNGCCSSRRWPTTRSRTCQHRTSAGIEDPGGHAAPCPPRPARARVRILTAVLAVRPGPAACGDRRLAADSRPQAADAATQPGPGRRGQRRPPAVRAADGQLRRHRLRRATSRASNELLTTKAKTENDKPSTR